jgi:hypothetical protein
LHGEQQERQEDQNSGDGADESGAGVTGWAARVPPP